MESPTPDKPLPHTPRTEKVLRELDLELAVRRAARMRSRPGHDTMRTVRFVGLALFFVMVVILLVLFYYFAFEMQGGSLPRPDTP